MKPIYSKYFKHPLPLFMHHSYTDSLEFSDKIILPRSIYYDIVRVHIPMPPLFRLRPQRSTGKPVYCAALEFTAQQDFLYLPLRIFGELGFRVINTDTTTKREFKSGYGLTLQTLPVFEPKPNYGYIYQIPSCNRLLVYSPVKVEQQFVRKGLSQYSMLNKNLQVSMMASSGVVVVLISEIYPEYTCRLEQDYVLDLTFQSPHIQTGLLLDKNLEKHKEKIVEPILPSKVRKIPQFLAKILNQHPKQRLLKPKEQLFAGGPTMESRQPSIDLDAMRNISDIALSPIQSNFKLQWAFSPSPGQDKADQTSPQHFHQPLQQTTKTNTCILKLPKLTEQPIHRRGKSSNEIIKRWYSKYRHRARPASIEEAEPRSTQFRSKKVQMQPGFIKLKVWNNRFHV